MKGQWFSVLIYAVTLGSGGSVVWAHDPLPFSHTATFATLITTPRAIEGLTGDHAGNLYTAGMPIPSLGDTFCPVWHVNLSSPTLVLVGKLPTPCSPLGIALNETGDLFVADSANAKVWSLTPNDATPPTATAFATGVPGANGLAFDRDGNLWLSDGGTGQGRVWKIGASGSVCEPTFTGCEEAFRLQPMRNGTALGGEISVIPSSAEPTQGVGRQARTLPHTAAGGNLQDIVANGLAFNHRGDLFVADTARGALWKVEFDHSGTLQSPTNCDTTFPDNTLCLDNVFVAHPLLEGADGIALDRAGNIWVDANERNAVVVVTKDGRVFEVFRNPVNTAGLRNAADTAVGDTHILEFPTSPFLSGKTFCTASLDANRRDNFPRSAGEVDGGNTTGTGKDLGKISCMDQEPYIRGLPLPSR
jgi:sugar lactone lactonase YvrE